MALTCDHDLMLPDADGISVLKRAKDLRPTVRSHRITGTARREGRRSMRLGAYDFIESTGPAALLKAVSRAVEKQRLSPRTAVTGTIAATTW